MSNPYVERAQQMADEARMTRLIDNALELTNPKAADGTTNNDIQDTLDDFDAYMTRPAVQHTEIGLEKEKTYADYSLTELADAAATATTNQDPSTHNEAWYHIEERLDGKANEGFTQEDIDLMRDGLLNLSGDLSGEANSDPSPDKTQNPFNEMSDSELGNLYYDTKDRLDDLTDEERKKAEPYLELIFVEFIQRAATSLDTLDASHKNNFVKRLQNISEAGLNELHDDLNNVFDNLSDEDQDTAARMLNAIEDEMERLENTADRSRVTTPPKVSLKHPDGYKTKVAPKTTVTPSVPVAPTAPTAPTAPEAAPTSEYLELNDNLTAARESYVKMAAAHTKVGLYSHRYSSDKLENSYQNYMNAAAAVMEYKEGDAQYLEQSGNDAETALKFEAITEALNLSQAVTAEQMEIADRKNPKLKAFYQKWANWGGGTKKIDRIKGTAKKAVVLAPVGAVVGGAAAILLPVVGAGLLASTVGVGITRAVGRNLMGSRIDRHANAPMIAEKKLLLRREEIINLEKINNERTAAEQMEAAALVTHESVTKANKRNSRRDLGGLLIAGAFGATAAALVDAAGVEPKFKLPKLFNIDGGLKTGASSQASANPGASASPSPEASARPDNGYGNGVGLSGNLAEVSPDGSQPDPDLAQSETPSGAANSETPANSAGQYDTLSIQSDPSIENGIQKQYNLTNAQAQRVYLSIKDTLPGTPGTYAINGDPNNTGVKNFGDLKFSGETEAALRQAIEDLEKAA